MALPDVTGGTDATTSTDVSTGAGCAGHGVEGDDRLEDLRRAHPAPDEDLLGGGVVEGCPDGARNEAVDRGLVEPEQGEHCRCRGGVDVVGKDAATLAVESSVAGTVVIVEPIWASWSAEIPHSRHQFHQRRQVVDVDRPDVGDEALTLFGRQAHVGEDVQSRGQRGGRRGGAARLGGEHRSTGEAAEGERGEGRGDQGFAHGPDRSPSPPSCADGTVE